MSPLYPKSLRFFLAGLLALWMTVAYSADWVTDETGRRITLPAAPKRIVSLAPNVTEILFSLGLDREVVGVSIHCDFPEKVKERERVGSYVSLDFEKIVSLRPDLIIATGAGNTREMVDRLEKLGFPTYVIFPKDFEGILRSIEHLGQILRRQREAREIVQGLERRKQRVIQVTRDRTRPKVFLTIGESPMVTVGKGSFADDLIHLAGGENVAAKEERMYPRWGMEEILRRAPEVILVSSMSPKGDYPKILDEWARWKMIPAVRDGRIHLINSDLVDRPSPRIIEGLEEMARLFHPEAFGK
jgi:iron complex transport system substrate-binding protein